jgi:hypothetical protein
VRERQDPPARPPQRTAPAPGGATPGAHAHAGHQVGRGRGVVNCEETREKQPYGDPALKNTVDTYLRGVPQRRAAVIRLT